MTAARRKRFGIFGLAQFPLEKHTGRSDVEGVYYGWLLGVSVLSETYERKLELVRTNASGIGTELKQHQEVWFQRPSQWVRELRLSQVDQGYRV